MHGNNPVVYYDSSGYAGASQTDEGCPPKGKIGGSDNDKDGYYQDENGRWHRPNGKFASNEEMGISSTKPTNSRGTHGNSLDDPRKNYGYVLTDRDTSEILKYGESISPDTRYSKGYLEDHNAKMTILDQGSKLDMHLWQHDMNERYKYGVYLPLNSKGC